MAKTTYYPIKGIQRGFGDNGEVPERMEIDDWWQSNDHVHIDQVSLFMAALAKFQNTPIEKKLSYFAIAGIHSEPKHPWDEGEESKPYPPERRDTNYCTHSENLFPTWHRSYQLLFEQRLYEIMTQDIIPGFPKSERTYLKHAADKWRLPYWDWAVKKPIVDTDPVWEQLDYDVPRLLRLETVKIRTPGGPKWVRNPLFSFKMPDRAPMSKGGVRPVIRKDRGIEIHFEQCMGTSRYPPTNDTKSAIIATFLNGYQDNDSIRRRLSDYTVDIPPDKADTNPRVVNGGNLTASLREVVNRVLAIKNFESFSTKQRRGDEEEAQDWSSLENVHDNMHGFCGGGYYHEPAYGHMSWVPVAAFDPIFWLHHNNVDRIFAIWQTLHPKAENKAYWYADPKRANESLMPFRKEEDGTYWDSDGVYETANLGYTYDTLPKIKSTDGEVKLTRELSDLNKELNEKYGSTRRAEEKAASTEVRSSAITVAGLVGGGPRKKVAVQVAQALGPSEKIDSKDLETFDYVANVKYERFALDGIPFSTHFFIGKVPEENSPVDAVERRNLVGGVFNFVAPNEIEGAESAGCANCQKQQDEGVESTGQVVLTNALLTRYKQKIVSEDTNDILQSMEPVHVIPYLKKNLHWVISGIKGDVIPKQEVPSLKVAVAMCKAKHYADITKLSEYEGYKVLYEVTEGRPAGASPQDHLFPVGDAYEG